MATQNEQDAAEAFMRDCEEPYGKRIAQELVPQLQEFLSKHRNRYAKTCFPLIEPHRS